MHIYCVKVQSFVMFAYNEEKNDILLSNQNLSQKHQSHQT